MNNFLGNVDKVISILTLIKRFFLNSCVQWIEDCHIDRFSTASVLRIFEMKINNQILQDYLIDRTLN